ncbi:adenosylcobalamin-dependent ribonucleoside-diphosphate reductase [archaeon]|jgi:ribonucleoside-diphosphate reductase alpha chain|nr:adenosylcobalamin-dependent ribonucleoside-diphosphate reductase [archaeon]MBT4373421.1 adenosylcobalamin-dependent ribonucleoside-diphosphate reductase [archaeon]MBT4531869.1 adenosylcobalamin-dependent ribonucleoside-diphosphate reductase [archaeon]MBT7001536.1 adenosylcobalamin-dependent ribonucleoside-diphosphate reductase [archaeon]MBT7282572.1 adenosylcobalamin-dependent ribonucleoside-diphosphate reductase [archaeon]
MGKTIENKTLVSKELPKYSFQEAAEASTRYFNGNRFAALTWLDKYALKDSFGNLYERTPEDMHHRIAGEIARVEANYKNPMEEEEIFELIKDFKYIVPQGSPMTGIGNDFQVASLSNCFVIGVQEESADSYGAIMQIDQEQVQLMKRRGGVGYDLSGIRPKASPVNNSALTSTGVVLFADRHSNSTREVAQDGRRGALMLSLSIRHPDAEDFIDAKMDLGRITGANCSVRVDDEFMNKALNGGEYFQQFPIETDDPKYTQAVNAGELWGKIIHNAWQSAEPGILFWDNIIRESLPDRYSEFGYKTTSTNPCGEIPLCPYDSCRLLALNLYEHVENRFTPEAEFNHDLFQKNVKKAQRIMDDIVDLELEKIDKILDKINRDPELDEIKSVERRLWEKIRKQTSGGRRTGLGIVGEADTLAALGLGYATEEGNQFEEKLHEEMALSAYQSSIEMSRERGAFSVYDPELEADNPFIERIREARPELYNEMQKDGRRNIALLTIAPTGTTSIMTQTSSGIEPLFAARYQRRKKIDTNAKTNRGAKVDDVDNVGDEWEIFDIVHRPFMEWAEPLGYSKQNILNMGKEELKELVKESPYNKSTAQDTDWVKKVELQGRVQKWVDHSISATVNLPEETTKETVAKVYQKAWEAGCKGITIYRDGSRGSGVMTTKENSVTSILSNRPKELEAEVLRFNNQSPDCLDKWIAFVGLHEGRPYEIFTGKSEEEVLAVPSNITEGIIVKEKDGQRTHYDFIYADRNGFQSRVGGISHQFDRAYWNYSRMISGMMRNQVPLEEIVHIIDKMDDKIEGIHSWKSGVRRALKKYIEDGTQTREVCKDCGQPFTYQEGCKVCGCGSKCE